MWSFLAFLSMALVLASCSVVEERKHEEHVERGKESHVEYGHQRHLRAVGEAPKLRMSEETKEALLKEKKGHVLFQKEIEYFLKNPNVQADRQCFDKLKPGHAIDFVIDLAPSPSLDKVDKVAAEESPAALFFQGVSLSASRAYFGAVQFLIDAVTVDMKPERTHSVIHDNGRKYFIRGRHVEDVESIRKLHQSGEFTDKTRNLKTLWPVPTNESVSNISPICKNNLGRMTKLALWNRDNGLPIVLAANRRSKPVYQVVISDGSSGADVHQLADDLSRTTVIDVGNRRFVNKIAPNDMKQLAGAYSLMSPQKLPLMFDTIRIMACKFVEHASEK